ncbi:uncharacterized protein LOC111867373 [Cryptotermes secundus]|nr:uncharacterized protein LOC111867373 [Cryptotermes secundus]
MPPLKPPMTLENRCLQAVDTLLHQICLSWIREMYAAAQTDSESYMHRTQFVLSQCEKLREVLLEVTKSVLNQFIPKLAGTFLDIITNYDDSLRALQPRFWDEDRHNIVSAAILRSVLNYTTEYYDTHAINSSFAQSLVIQTLDSVPGLLDFNLDTGTQIQNSSLLASKIHHLKLLRTFRYFYDCTDEVIEQLRLHCPQLRKINVTGSYGVTDASVRHLMQLRELRSVRVCHTSISEEHYGLLLPELPHIKDITFWKPESNLLDHIAVENLDTISHVIGYIEDINMVTQKCPNMTYLDLYSIPDDLSPLRVLTALDSLQISNAHYGTCNLTNVLRGIGHRLRYLRLYKVRYANLQDIVTLCPCLEILTLWECIFSPLNQNTRIDPQLPHFRSVITLKIRKKFRGQISYNYLLYYVRLKTIILDGVNIFTMDVMREALRRGTFTHLEHFYILETSHGVLTIEAVDLLIEHCSYLKGLGYLGRCPCIDQNSIQQLKSRILERNFDLEIED